MTRPAARALLVAVFLLLSACAPPRLPDGAPPAGLEQLTFTGEGFRAVELDGYGLARGPHWPLRAYPPLIAGNVPEEYRLRGAPVAYLGGSRPEVELVARVPGSWAGTVRVRGAGGGMVFEGEGQAAAGELHARAVARAVLPRRVERQDWRVSWRARAGEDDVALGTSRARLYVLLAEPRGPLLHTPLELAAAGAAGAESAAAVVAGVWRAFAAKEVRRARDGRPLRYYGEYLAGAPAELRRLLVSGTGQCVAWSYLLQAAVAAHGAEAEIVGVYPPAGGRLFIQPWRFHRGTRFIETGANGVAETEPGGDDVALIPRGRGVPFSRIWAPEPLPIDHLGGDDTLAYMVGRNGIMETDVDTALALPLLARGFGLEQQRAYELAAGADPAAIELGGDDVVVRQDGVHFVLTGANGVLETARQPGMAPGPARGSAWEPVVGHGSTALRVQGALPRAWPVSELGGDDRDWRWFVNTGGDGISQTPGAARGQGLAHAVTIGAGANGRLDSAPGGDDLVVDLAEYLALAPAGYEYVSAFNMWPEPGGGAQQNPWPPTDYPYHVLVRIGGRYYDPAYGTGPFDSVLAWERATLAGVGARLQRAGEGLRVGEQALYAVRRSDGAVQLTETRRLPPPD